MTSMQSFFYFFYIFLLFFVSDVTIPLFSKNPTAIPTAAPTGLATAAPAATPVIAPSPVPAYTGPLDFIQVSEINQQHNCMLENTFDRYISGRLDFLFDTTNEMRS